MHRRRISPHGLSRLLMRRPDLRGFFPMHRVTRGVLRDLCEAYDEATRALDHLRVHGAAPAMLIEYAELCQAIEDEFAAACQEERG